MTSPSVSYALALPAAPTLPILGTAEHVPIHRGAGEIELSVV